MHEKDLVLYKSIFVQTPVSTHVFTPEGETVMVNAAWENFWQIKFPQVKKYNILKDKQLMNAGVMPIIKRGFKGETVCIPAIEYALEKSIPIKGAIPSKWVAASMFPIKDNSGKIRYIVLQYADDLASSKKTAVIQALATIIGSIARDITQQKLDEQMMRESEERFRLAVSAGKIGVWDWDIMTNNLKWSERVYDIHGVNAKKFNATFENFRSLIYPEDRKKVHEKIERALGGKQDFNAVFRIVRPNGEIRWITTSATVIRDAKAKPLRMLGAASDITREKNLEQERDDFVGIATHELKTPVTSLKAYAEVLQRKFAKDGDMYSSEQLSKMNAQLDKLTMLISDLLDATKIESGKLRMHIEKFDFDSLVSEIVEELQRTTERHTLIIKGETKKKVEADKERVGQVLTNFISNAIKYSPHASKIVILASASKDRVKVCVQDFGVGIPKPKQAKLFQRFYRVTGQKEITFPGIGLGLYISKEIIQRQQGKIWMESAFGKGSTFCFYLPLKVKTQNAQNKV